jgi:hypothetical protein
MRNEFEIGDMKYNINVNASHRSAAAPAGIANAAT